MAFFVLAVGNCKVSCKCLKFRVEIPKLHLCKLIPNCKEPRKSGSSLHFQTIWPSGLPLVLTSRTTVCAWGRKASCADSLRQTCWVRLNVSRELWQWEMVFTCLYFAVREKNFPLETRILELQYGLHKISCITLSNIFVEMGVLLCNHFMSPLCWASVLSRCQNTALSSGGCSVASSPNTFQMSHPIFASGVLVVRNLLFW